VDAKTGRGVDPNGLEKPIGKLQRQTDDMVADGQVKLVVER
jgi:hypothetical protein